MKRKRNWELYGEPANLPNTSSLQGSKEAQHKGTKACVANCGIRSRAIPPLPDVNICDSEWLVFNASGFPSEGQARNFGHKLRAALEVSSVATRLGVDVGKDVATAGLGNLFRKEIEQRTGHHVRDNIHGIDVFVDAPNVRILHLEGTGEIHARPDPFLSDLADLFDIAASASPRTKDVVLLLNSVLMQTNPVAQIVFAFSAVEMLGQEHLWTCGQTALLEKLTEMAQSSSDVSDEERGEVADAIRKCHRLSLRQGVMRLLDSIELSSLRPVWDKLYSERSTLVHGLAPRPGADYGALAAKAINLCGRILLSTVAIDIPLANRHVDRFYEQG